MAETLINTKSGEVKITDGQTEQTIVKEPDLVTRVSQFTPKEEPKPEVKNEEFDFKELENIKDPEAKAWAEKAYKSFQKGYTQKFQELAEIKKKIEVQPVPSEWTPERLQQEMSKSDFVSSAQQIVELQTKKTSGMTEEEFSALSDVIACSSIKP